jgi:hypothetical protein
MTFQIESEAEIEVSNEQAHLLMILQSFLDAGALSLARINAAGEFPQAIALLVGQAVASGHALHVLCVVGRARQAHPTARSMLENVINAHFIALAPEVRAKRFWAHRPIPHAKVAEARFETFGITDELEELRTQAVEAEKLLGNQHWAGKASIRARAEECGMLEVWGLHYTESSAFIHGDASTWNAFTSDDGLVMKFGPSPEGIEAVVAPALSAVFVGLQLLSHVLEDHGLMSELERIGRSLPEKTKRIDLSSVYGRLPNKG